ncbi:MAG: hypothetical protein K5639_06550, partial [Eubacterium sp.]|nr:hypothetical protein [Eubacterium sp.]
MRSFRKIFRQSMAFVLILSFFAGIGGNSPASVAGSVSGKSGTKTYEYIDTDDHYCLKTDDLNLEITKESSEASSKCYSGVTPQNNEYSSSLANYVSNTMNKQLIAYFSGSDGTKATMKSTDYNQYKTAVEFKMSNSKISGMSVTVLLRYIAEAIANNPNFCTLSTEVYWLAKNNKSYSIIGVYSVIPKSLQLSSVKKYKKFLASIEQRCKESGLKNDSDILLYLHDAMIQRTEYAPDLSKNEVYIPLATAKGSSVCQSYAVVYNHLMKDMGFTSLFVRSNSHAWNAVKLNGKWYHIDTTWDDPSNQPADVVTHKFFLVGPSRFKASDVSDKSAHDFDYLTQLRYPDLNSKIGTEYDNYYPRSVYYPMCYKDGYFYHNVSGSAYRWKNGMTYAEEVDSIQDNAYLRFALLDSELFVSGNNGVSRFYPDTESLVQYDPASIVRMFEGWNYSESQSVLRLVTSDSELYYIPQTSGYETYEELNGNSNKEKITLTKPGKPGLAAKSLSAKSITATIKKAASNANGGYQFQVAKNKSFKSGKKTKTLSTTRTAKFTGL